MTDRNAQKAAERALRTALVDPVTGRDLPVATDAAIGAAAKAMVDAVTPFLIVEGAKAAARQITGNDQLSRAMREVIGRKAESLYRAALKATSEREAA